MNHPVKTPCIAYVLNRAGKRDESNRVGVLDLSPRSSSLHTAVVLGERGQDRATHHEEQHCHGHGYCAEGDKGLDSEVIVHGAQRTGGDS